MILKADVRHQDDFTGPPVDTMAVVTRKSACIQRHRLPKGLVVSWVFDCIVDGS